MEDFYNEEIDFLRAKLRQKEFEIASLKAHLSAMKTIMEGRYELAKKIAERKLNDSVEHETTPQTDALERCY